MNTLTKALRCLIVEDSADDAELLLRALRTGDRDVTWERVETAGAMRAALDGRPWDLVISDYSMPQFSGLAALEVLKASGQDLPFIIVSGTMGEEQVVIAMRAGVHDYFIKGRLAHLIPAVERELGNAKVRREQRRTVAVLRESEQQLQTYIDNAGDAIYVLEQATGRIRNCNARACHDLGYSRAELLQLSTQDLEARLPASAVAAVHQQLKPEAVQTVNGTHRRKDGTLFPVEIRLSSLAPAHPELVIAIVRDSSARLRAEEAQRDEATRWRVLFEQSTDGIVVMDQDGKVWGANHRFAEMLGYARDEVRQLHIWDWDAHWTREQLLSKLRSVDATGTFIETRHRRKDGSIYDVELNSNAASVGGEKLIFCVCRDVTERKRMELHLRQTAKMEAVGQLAGGVAHDFNNQLQIIVLTLGVLLKNLPPEHPHRDNLLIIQETTQRSAALTRQLLAFSRQEAVTPVVLDLNRAIAGSLKMLGRLLGEDIQLRFVQLTGLWSVFMDPNQLDQILANFSVNARDAIAGAGTISVEVANHTLGAADCQDKPDFVPPGDYVSLTFSDDGQGMPSEVQARLFEPFFTTKEVGKGTGLGLATVYGIVRQNHGAITVASTPGRGTTFTIYLPRSKKAAPVAVQQTAERAPTGTETVLLVEDDQRVQELVLKTMNLQGYHMLSAPTPAEALQLCASHPEPIHLLLTDVIMPGMSGLKLADYIQKLRPGIRTLYISGYTADSIRQHGYQPEGLRILPKPFTAAVLAQHVRAALAAAAPTLAEAP